MPYVVQATGFRWVDPSEEYKLQEGESFSEEEPQPPVVDQTAIVEKVAPLPTLVEQILADPASLAELKKALGL